MGQEPEALVGLHNQISPLESHTKDFDGFELEVIVESMPFRENTSSQLIEVTKPLLRLLMIFHHNQLRRNYNILQL